MRVKWIRDEKVKYPSYYFDNHRYYIRQMENRIWGAFATWAAISCARSDMIDYWDADEIGWTSLCRLPYVKC